jgi:hypothetical protein
MMKNTYTPYKTKTGTQTPQLRRSSTQLSCRSNDGNGNITRKKVARNLVVLGSSQKTPSATQQNFFSNQQSLKV